MPKILLYSTLREKLGIKELWVDAEGTLEEILKAVEKRGYPITDLVLDGGGIRKGYIILVNGRNVVHLNGLETPVGRGDKVAIFPPAGGG